MAGLRGPLLLGRIAVADRDADAELLAEECHPPGHVPVQRPKGGDVEATDGLRLLHKNPVQDRENRGLRLADSRGGNEEYILPRHDFGNRAPPRLREVAAAGL